MSISALKERIKRSQDILDKFKAEFEKDPAYALSWCDTAFEAAAELRVFQLIVGELKHGSKIEHVMNYARDKLLVSSRRVPSSTSATSNLIDQHKIAAYASAYDMLKYMKD